MHFDVISILREKGISMFPTLYISIWMENKSRKKEKKREWVMICVTLYLSMEVSDRMANGKRFKIHTQNDTLASCTGHHPSSQFEILIYIYWICCKLH